MIGRSFDCNRIMPIGSFVLSTQQTKCTKFCTISLALLSKRGREIESSSEHRLIFAWNQFTKARTTTKNENARELMDKMEILMAPLFLPMVCLVTNFYCVFLHYCHYYCFTFRFCSTVVPVLCSKCLAIVFEQIDRSIYCYFFFYLRFCTFSIQCT